ncbi:hypothetical protein C8R46DRAFT_1361195 [Mycena filopes]|nr:hypothetical protein C8R46DRAFT_1361195 [Mycena filopes]
MPLSRMLSSDSLSSPPSDPISSQIREETGEAGGCEAKRGVDEQVLLWRCGDNIHSFQLPVCSLDGSLGETPTAQSVTRISLPVPSPSLSLPPLFQPPLLLLPPLTTLLLFSEGSRDGDTPITSPVASAPSSTAGPTSPPFLPLAGPLSIPIPTRTISGLTASTPSVSLPPLFQPPSLIPPPLTTLLLFSQVSRDRDTPITSPVASAPSSTAGPTSPPFLTGPLSILIPTRTVSGLTASTISSPTASVASTSTSTAPARSKHANLALLLGLLVPLITISIAVAIGIYRWRRRRRRHRLYTGGHDDLAVEDIERELGLSGTPPQTDQHEKQSLHQSSLTASDDRSYTHGTGSPVAGAATLSRSRSSTANSTFTEPPPPYARPLPRAPTA